MTFLGYGKVSGSSSDGGKKKKLAILGVCTLLLVAMVVAVSVAVTRSNHTNSGGSGNNSGNGEIHASIKAVKAICQPTDFKETCESSLSSAAGNTTDPKELVKVAFNVTIQKVKEVFQHSELLKAAAKDPRTKKALENCGELMEYSIDDLRTSLNSIGTFDLSKLDEIVEDVKMWLSGSITYQETCLDGFQGTTGPTAEKMKQAMKAASELTRNVLAIISEISSVVQNFDISSLMHRKLLESEIPSWVSDSGRKLLTVDQFKPDVVVAKDGSGKFKTINEAVATVPLKSNNTYIIYIKEGVYKEQVLIDKKMWNVVMIGDGPTKTKITGSLNFIDGTPTFQTATVAAVGEGFIAKNIGFENSAGPEKHQAVALRVQSDRSIFYNCQMDGYQDTLYFHTHRQFYRDCTVSGTIDFLFGNAAAVFQNCKLVVRKPMDNQQNIITAQGRKDRREPTGLVIHNCTIVADPAYAPVKNKVPTYLGRPWKQYSRTFFIQSDLGDFIQPAGWLPWEGDFALNTCFYAEYENRGLSSNQSQRVKWRGIKKLTGERAKLFTVERFLGGNRWIKSKGIPFTPGLFPSLQ